MLGKSQRVPLITTLERYHHANRYHYTFHTASVGNSRLRHGTRHTRTAGPRVREREPTRTDHGQGRTVRGSSSHPDARHASVPHDRRGISWTAARANPDHRCGVAPLHPVHSRLCSFLPGSLRSVHPPRPEHEEQAAPGGQRHAVPFDPEGERDLRPSQSELDRSFGGRSGKLRLGLREMQRSQQLPELSPSGGHTGKVSPLPVFLFIIDTHEYYRSLE